MSYYAPNLPKEKHCFFGSNGGVSKGIYQSLNGNFKGDDAIENVYENFRIVAHHFNLELENVNLLHEGISNRAVYIEESSLYQIEADSVVTDKPNILLCLVTADCAPVLMRDDKNGVIGAAHAGWRGAFTGIIENTVKLMLEKGAELSSIKAAIGPCIAQQSYEVDQNFYNIFIKKSLENKRFFKQGNKNGFYQFDLQGFTAFRLTECGIQNISCSNLDTYALKDEYFSFRRNTHLGLVHKKDCFPNEISTLVL